MGWRMEASTDVADTKRVTVLSGGGEEEGVETRASWWPQQGCGCSPRSLGKLPSSSRQGGEVTSMMVTRCKFRNCVDLSEATGDQENQKEDCVPV